MKTNVNIEQIFAMNH